METWSQGETESSRVFSVEQQTNLVVEVSLSSSKLTEIDNTVIQCNIGLAQFIQPVRNSKLTLYSFQFLTTINKLHD